MTPRPLHPASPTPTNRGSPPPRPPVCDDRSRSAPPVSTAQPDASTPVGGDAPGPAPTTAATGELLISVDTPSSVTVDGDAVGRFQLGVPQPLAVGIGQHLVIATAEDGVTRG